MTVWNDEKIRELAEVVRDPMMQKLCRWLLEARAAARVVDQKLDLFDALARKYNYPGSHGPQVLRDAFEALKR
jgi:hypothetical protein